ncbi:putative zn-finger protein [Globisporangium polare]
MQHRVPIRLGKLRTSVRDAPAAAGVAVHIDSSSISGGDSSGAALFAASVARICRVCTQNASRYTCPRCNAPYCSVACYKQHGESCTERFYEEHVRDVVQLDSKSSGERDAQRKMNDMLARVKRFQDESADRMGNGNVGDENTNEGDEELQMEILEALAQLALADDESISLDDLTPAQRKQFMAEVADGRLSQFIRLWGPWWLMDARKYERETEVKRRQLVIQEIGSGNSSIGLEEEDGDEEEEDVEASGPVMIESAAFPAELFTKTRAANMPESLNGLLPQNRPPSPALRFHLMEILFSYALVMRTFNGDWQQDTSEAAAALLHLSAVLSADAKYESIEHVLHACLLKRIDTEYEATGASTTGGRGSREVSQRILHDVTLLLSAKVFLLDALSDAQAMLVAYRKELLDVNVGQEATLPPASMDSKSKKTKSSKAEKERRQATRKLELVDRKLQFFLTWAFHTPEAHFQTTAREIERAAAAATEV